MTATKTRILSEATRQLTAHGYAAFTIASVREALGLSSGSMFHAFESKPALAAAVYVEGMAAYQRAAVAAIGRRGDPELSVRAWIDVHLSWIEGHRELARFLFSTMPDEVMAAAAGPLAAHNAAYYAELAAMFERAAAAGLMAAMERSLAQALCIGPSHEYGRQWTQGLAPTPPRQLSSMFQNAALASLRATVRSPIRKRKETNR